MIKINNDRKVWVTSDCHYAHKNICRGITNWRLPNGDVPEKQTRDFATLDKMNAAIVNNINEVVGQDDILINLGDWSFSGFEMIEESEMIEVKQGPYMDDKRRFTLNPK